MTTAFARITAMHDAIALALTPCAGQLHRFLLRKIPAGTQQELILEAFAQWSSQHRHRAYSIRHIQRALQELIDVGLVNIVYRYTARIFKLICLHPGQDENVQKQDQKVQAVTEMSETEGSKPCPAVPSYRESRETTDTSSSLHPVLNSRIDKEEVTLSPQPPNLENLEKENQDENKEILRTASPTSLNSQDVPLSSEEIKIDPQLQAEVEAVIAPMPMNQNIKRAVMSVSLEIVLDALAVVRQQKKAGKAKRPAGLLVKAIQERWIPNPIDAVLELIPDGFNEWFDLAREKRIVTASMLMDGQMCVCTDPEQGDWQPWTELAFAFPLRMLKEMNPIKFRLSQNGSHP
ncbi:MAG: hypothetical protein WA902_14380 [Thermosynechococcaceae cyanobacterium]